MKHAVKINLAPRAVYLATILAATTLSTGCSATSPYAGGTFLEKSTSSKSVDLFEYGATLTSRLRHLEIQPDRKASWLQPGVQKQRLLYVSDVGKDDVDIYTYDTGKLVGQLTGFNEPQGMCSDSKGDVYVANTLSSNIFEFAHGATSPSQIFSDPGQFPVDCAATKNGLTIANIGTTSGGIGSVSVLEGTKIITTVSSQNLPKIYSVGLLPVQYYNFMTATNANGKTYYAKYGYTSDRIRQLKTPVNSPGSVRFSGIGKEMAVGDQGGTIYLVHGTVVSSKIELSGLCAAGQFSISQHNIIVPDPCGAQVLVYSFPAGGQPMRKITDELVDPVGTAISLNNVRGPE